MDIDRISTNSGQLLFGKKKHKYFYNKEDVEDSFAEDNHCAGRRDAGHIVRTTTHGMTALRDVHRWFGHLRVRCQSKKPKKYKRDSTRFWKTTGDNWKKSMWRPSTSSKDPATSCVINSQDPDRETQCQECETTQHAGCAKATSGETCDKGKHVCQACFGPHPLPSCPNRRWRPGRGVSSQRRSMLAALHWVHGRAMRVRPCIESMGLHWAYGPALSKRPACERTAMLLSVRPCIARTALHWTCKPALRAPHWTYGPPMNVRLCIERTACIEFSALRCSHGPSLCARTCIVRPCIGQTALHCSGGSALSVRLCIERAALHWACGPAIELTVVRAALHSVRPGIERGPADGPALSVRPCIDGTALHGAHGPAWSTLHKAHGLEISMWPCIGRAAFIERRVLHWANSPALSRWLCLEQTALQWAHGFALGGTALNRAALQWAAGPALSRRASGVRPLFPTLNGLALATRPLGVRPCNWRPWPCIDCTALALHWPYGPGPALTVRPWPCIDRTALALHWPYGPGPALTVRPWPCIDRTALALHWPYGPVLTARPCIDRAALHWAHGRERSQSKHKVGVRRSWALEDQLQDSTETKHENQNVPEWLEEFSEHSVEEGASASSDAPASRNLRNCGIQWVQHL